MYIYLHYENFEVNGECYDREQPYDAISPRTHQGTYTMDYDYKVYVNDEDICEFLESQIGDIAFRNFTSQKQEGFRAAIKKAFLEDLFCEEQLKENEDFIEFLENKYRDDAQEQCHADYDD